MSYSVKEYSTGYSSDEFVTTKQLVVIPTELGNQAFD